MHQLQHMAVLRERFVYVLRSDSDPERHWELRAIRLKDSTGTITGRAVTRLRIVRGQLWSRL